MKTNRKQICDRSVLRLGRLLLCTAGLVFLCACAPTVFYPNAFETGRVLEPGRTEVAAHSFVVVPAGLSFARGLGSDVELRGNVGIVGGGDIGDVGGLELGLAQRLSRDGPFHSSGSAAVQFFSTFDQPVSLLGGRATVGGTFSYYPASWLGVSLPLKSGILAARGYPPKLLAIPGLGISLEPKHFLIRLACNVQIPLPLNTVGSSSTEISTIPFVGLQAGYSW